MRGFTAPALLLAGWVAAVVYLLRADLPGRVPTVPAGVVFGGAQIGLPSTTSVVKVAATQLVAVQNAISRRNEAQASGLSGSSE